MPHAINVVNYYPFLDFIGTGDSSNEGVRLSVGRLLTSTLPFYILRFVLFYVIVAGVWVLLLETVIKDAEDHAPVVETSYGLIVFSLSFIYWLWIREGLSRMSKKPQIYEDLLAGAESFARALIQLLPCDITEKCKTGAKSACYTIEEIRMLLCAAITSFTFVMLNDPSNMKHPKKHTVCDLSLTEVLSQKLSSYEPEDELEISHYIIDMIEDRVKRLRDDKELDSSAASLFEKSQSMEEKLRIIRTDREKQSYEFVNLFMLTALALVILFFPYIIWPQARVFTLLLYPLLMFIITGLPIAILWYGDAFEGTPGQNAIDYRHKERRSSLRVYKTFERYFTGSNCVQFQW